MSKEIASMDLYGVYGIGGCGRSLMPVARWQYSHFKSSSGYLRLMFIDDSIGLGEKRFINGHAAVNLVDFLAIPARHRYVNIAIADGRTREKLYTELFTHGVMQWTIRADNAVVMDDVEISDGASLSPFVTLTSNVRIGRCFHANLYSYVEHDCVIGDFVTFAPGVKCNGNVVVEDYAYLGAGSLIKQGSSSSPLVIGKGATVGMGAVVTKSVAPGTTVVGNPARVLNK